MKQAIRMIIIKAVLLLVGATTAQAQQAFGGKLTCNGASIKYSVSGVTITEKKKEDTGAHLTWEISGTVKPGSTVNVSMERTEGKGQSRMAIVSDYRREDDLSMAGIQYEMQPKTSDSKSISISNNSGRYTIVMDFDNKDGNSWSHIKVRLYLKVNGTTTTTTPPKPNEVKAENYKGTFERHGGKMEYSFTNCKVTYKKEDNKFPNYDLHPYYNTTVAGAGIGSYIKGNVKPGAAMTLACKKVKGNTTLDSVMIQVEVTNGANTLIKKTYKGKGALSRSLQVPKNADRVSVCLAYAYLDATFQTRIDLDVAEELPDVPGNKFKWNIVADDDRCAHCKGLWSEYTINWGSTSEYATMCNSEKNWHQFDIGSRNVTNIFYNDHIATNGERLTLSKGETHNNYHRDEEIIFRGNTHAWLRKRLDDGTDRWSFYKGFIIGKHLKRSGKPSSSFETDELVVVPKGTIYILQKDDDKTQAYLLQGSMDVTNRKNNKKVTLKPGQVATGTKNGQMKVQKFDVNAMAKKYGITLNGTGNTGLVFTAGNLHYKILSEKTVELTGELRGSYKGRVEIPSQVKHGGKTYQVVGIGQNTFADQTQMTSVVIPKSIRGIAEDAFRNTGLTEVVIPGDEVNINQRAFRDCKKLTVVTANGKKPNCSASAFEGCTNMKELRIRGISERNNGKQLNGTPAVIKVIK